jgi:hypothetical protein
MPEAKPFADDPQKNADSTMPTILVPATGDSTSSSANSQTGSNANAAATLVGTSNAVKNGRQERGP